MKNATVYYMSGNKGGVGKSVIGVAFLDYLVSGRKAPLLIETDTGNPDVGQPTLNAGATMRWRAALCFRPPHASGRLIP